LDLDLFKTEYLPKFVKASILKSEKRDIKQQLASLQLFDLVHDCPTVAGVLLIGKDPKHILFGSYIQYVQFAGKTRTSKVLNERQFSGNLPTHSEGENGTDLLMSKRYAQVGKEYAMGNKEKSIRVGTTLYKIVRRPLISGDYIEEKIIWSYETLRKDYGKNNLPEIEKYDGFCIIPNHINYMQVYGTYPNQYEPINHVPCEGEFPYIRMFLEHIFEEQIELAYDYIQLLYRKPTQNPIPLNDGLLSLIRNSPEDGNLDNLVFTLPSYESCCKSVKRWVKRAGINKHISWHCARHSFAVNILNNGANIKTVASLLGHSGLKHT
jgi:hypothetical protein